MKTPLLTVLFLPVLGFLSVLPAQAQCGVSYGCVTSFTISPGTIVGDQAHIAVGTITAAGPGTDSWTVLINKSSWPLFYCANGEYFPGAPSTPPGCHVTGSTAVVWFYSYNGSGVQVSQSVRVQDDPDHDTG